MIHPHGSCFCWAGFTCRFTVARSRCSEPHTFLPRPIQDFFFYCTRLRHLSVAALHLIINYSCVRCWFPKSGPISASSLKQASKGSIFSMNQVGMGSDFGSVGWLTAATAASALQKPAGYSFKIAVFQPPSLFFPILTSCGSAVLLALNKICSADSSQLASKRQVGFADLAP